MNIANGLDDVLQVVRHPQRLRPAHTAIASRSTWSRKLAGRLSGVSTSTSIPSNCFSSNRIAPMSISVVCAAGSTNRSRSLSAVSSPCSAEPNTRTLLTRWRNAISRICERCRDRASEGRMYWNLACRGSESLRIVMHYLFAVICCR